MPRWRDQGGRPARTRPNPAALALFAALLAAGPLLGQVPDIQGGGADLQVPQSGPAPEPATLPLDPLARKKLKAAHDYLAGRHWAEAVRLLQTLLDDPEDSFLSASPGGGKRAVRWAGTRAEADRLLAGLPTAGLEYYRLAFDGGAARALAEARGRGDPHALAEVARRYAYTRSGSEALTLLGTYHLDRGQAELAALCFARLLGLPDSDRLPPTALFRAALAFRLSGDTARADDAWARLSRAAPGGAVRLGRLSVRLDQLLAATGGVNGQDGSEATTLFRRDRARAGRAEGGHRCWSLASSCLWHKPRRRGVGSISRPGRRRSLPEHSCRVPCRSPREGWSFAATTAASGPLTRRRAARSGTPSLR